MTFTEYLKIEKNIDAESKNLADLMDEYYEEYSEYMLAKKDGCREAERPDSKLETD